MGAVCPCSVHAKSCCPQGETSLRSGSMRGRCSTPHGMYCIAYGKIATVRCVKVGFPLSCDASPIVTTGDKVGAMYCIALCLLPLQVLQPRVPSSTLASTPGGVQGKAQHDKATASQVEGREVLRVAAVGPSLASLMRAQQLQPAWLASGPETMWPLLDKAATSLIA